VVVDLPEVPMPVELKSSNIKSADHDHLSGTMTVNFRDGSSYRYLNVPRDVWLEFSKHPSPGKYFRSSIRGIFQHKKV